MITGLHAIVFSTDADGVRAFFRDTLAFASVEFTRDITDVRCGLLTAFKVPGGGELALYEPRHPTAIAASST